MNVNMISFQYRYFVYLTKNETLFLVIFTKSCISIIFIFAQKAKKMEFPVFSGNSIFTWNIMLFHVFLVLQESL